jgi:hypothetical protein
VQLINNTGSGSEVHVVVVRSAVGGNVLVGNNTLIGTIRNEVGAFKVEIKSGNLQVYNNSATGGSEANEVFAEVIQVGVNLDVHNNTAEGPGFNAVLVIGNTVTNNLACHNDKPPASGSGNTAKHKTGECEPL